MQIWSLGSSSSGNAFVIEHKNSAILVDAGFSAREITRKLKSVGIAPESVCAIFLTHEHLDHIRGAKRLAKQVSARIYMNPKIQKLFFSDCESWHPLVTGEKVKVEKFFVHPFSVPHDALDPLGLRVEIDGVSICVCIDLGCSTPLVEYNLMRSNLWLIESNHDPVMLKEGPYPWELKQRIASPFGHLSNHATAEIIKHSKHSELLGVLLVHLSETNNTPVLAHKTASSVIAEDSTNLSIAHPNNPVKLLEL